MSATETLPHDFNIEASILSLCLLHPEDIPAILNDGLSEDNFYSTRHQIIFKAIKTLFLQQKPVDLITVNHFLSETGQLEGAGKTSYLTKISNTPVPSSIEYYCSILQEHSSRRKTITGLNQALQDCYNSQQPIAEQILSIQKVLYEVDTIKGERVHIRDVVLPITEFCKIERIETPSLLHPFIKSPSIGMVVGPRGVSKTWFCLGIGKAIALGNKFGPWQAERAAMVLFLDGEMTAQDMVERAKILELDAIDNENLLIYCDSHASQLGLSRANLTDESWRKSHKDYLVEQDIKFQVIDNVASLSPGIDENSKQDWDPINQWLIDLRFTGISTLLVHHAGKNGTQRGTSGREDNLDYSIELKKPTNYYPEDGARFIAHFSKARVSNRNLHLISDIEFKLQEVDGRHQWLHSNLKQSNREEVLRLLDGGLEQKAIAETLGISKSTVSKIRKKAIEQGDLTSKNKLTQSGFITLNGGEA